MAETTTRVTLRPPTAMAVLQDVHAQLVTQALRGDELTVNAGTIFSRARTVVLQRELVAATETTETPQT